MAIINGTKAGDFITGTQDGDTIFGRGGDDQINGGRGNDFVLMGAGNDIFTWNPGDGSDTVLGGRGFDTLAFNGANIGETFEIVADGRNAELTRNVANIVMELGSVERIELATLGGSDTIHVGDLGKSATNQVAIDLGDFNGTGGDGAADSVVADGSDRSDHIRVSTENGVVSVDGLHAAITVANAETSDTLTINALGGNDTIDASGFSSMQLILNGGDGNDTVIGGRGNDVILLGDGNDRFTWNPGDGSDVVEGGAGIDTVVFNGSNVGENMDVSANGARLELTRDVGAIHMDMNGIEQLDIHALGGADTVTVNDLSGTGVQQVAIDLGATTMCGSGPDADIDTVVVNGTQTADTIKIASSGQQIVVTGLPAEVTIDNAGKNDVLTVNGLGGDDVIDASKLGANKVLLQLNGGEGNDTITGSAGDDVIDGNRGNDTLNGGAGNDKFIWNPGDGSDTIDGGSGTDTLAFNGANISERFNISASADHVRFTRDVANITMDLAHVERIDLQTLGGADQIIVNDLSATAVKEVVIHLSGSLAGGTGDGAADSVFVNGSTADNNIHVSGAAGAISVTGLSESVSISDAETGDALVINSLAGNDTIDASALATGSMGLTIHGGEGNDLIFGGAGADTLFGDAGNDTVTWQLGGGSDKIDGGTGTDTLNLMGGAGDDAFQIFANGADFSVTATDGAKLDVAGVEQIALKLGGGKDSVTIGDLSGTGVHDVAVDLGAGSKGEAVNVTAAAGEIMVIESKGGHTIITNENTFQTITLDNADPNDVLSISSPFGAVPGEVIQASSLTMSLHFTGGSGADTIFSGSGDDVIDGNQGNDVALMGAGNDVYNWDPGDGSDTVNGQAGFDTLRFNGSNVGENIEILADGTHAELTRDVANITMHLNSVERIEVNTLGGADHLHVTDMTGSGVKEVAIDLAAFGGTTGDGALDTVTIEGSGGNDHVTVSSANGVITFAGLAATTTVAHAESNDVISLNGNDGNDTINAFGVEDGVGGRLSIDGGAGNDTITGGHGSDLIFGGDGHDILSGGDGADTLDGGSNDDVLTGGKGDDTLIGGDGADTFNYTGALDGHDVIADFSGSQGDRLNLTQLFDNLGVNAGDRAGRVSIIDHGDGTVDVAVDADGNKANGFEQTVATLHTHDPVTIGHEVAVNG